MHISKLLWVALAVGGLALLMRLPGLGQFMTADEENWMLRSAGFYHNLFRKGDTGGTFMTTHPGATAMWLAGAGIVFQEQRLGFDIDTSNVGAFRRAAVLPVTLAVAGLIGIATWLAMRLMGTVPGVAGGVLLALEPYLAGMSQIAHLDALLALLMLNSVLAFLGRKSAWAGIFAGLAMATKLMPAMWLFVFFGVISSLTLPRQAVFGGTIARLGLIFGIATLSFYIAWPALWFTDDLMRSFNRDVPSVVTQAHVAVEESEEPTSPASFYARTLLGRTTPFVLIVSAGALALVTIQLLRPHFAKSSPLRQGYAGQAREILWLLLYALGFLLLITVAAKKADRYALPALAALPVIAGWALSAALKIRNPKSEIRNVSSFVLRASKFLFVLIILLLLAQIGMWSPYTIAYNSPFFDVRPLSQQGWGEGLEQAAAWLNQQPRVQEAFVASWYPSVMRVFFTGNTLSLSSRYDDRVGFVVLYRNMMGRGPDDLATNVLEEFQNQKPIHTVEIQGVPYAWVYDVRGLHYFPQHVGELFGDKTVGQLVPIEQDNWSAIEIGLATFSSRNNRQDMILHVRENLGASEDVRTIRANARDVQDSSYHRFEFKPIADSAGKTYYVWLESPFARPGDAITVRFSNDDLLPGEMVRGGAVAIGRDVAHRIPSQQQLQ